MAIAVRAAREQLRGVAASFGAVRRFRHDLYRHWRPLLGAAGCSLGYSAARLAEPWPLKVIFDNVLIGTPLATPIPWLDRAVANDRTRILLLAIGAILVLAFLRSLFYYYQRFLTARVGQQVVAKVRQRLFAHLQRLSLSFHARSSTGDLLTRLTGDIVMLRELVVASLLSLLAEGGILIGFVVVMILLEWRVAVVALVVVPVIFAFAMIYSERIRRATSKQRRREGELAARLQEALAGIHVVQAFAREHDEDERLRDLNRRSLRSGLKATKLEAKLNRAVELAVAAGTAAALWFGATQVIAGRLTPGELIVFVAYLQGFYRPLRRISRVTQRAAKAATCVERITEVLDHRTDVPDGHVEAAPFAGEIRFEEVQFAYTPSVPVLRGISFAAEAGQTIALVGPTGAGKTTVLALVPRFYDPVSGRVEIDGQDVRDFTLKSLRDQVAIVPQDGVLFGSTIYENIAYGRPDAAAEEIDAAAQAARIRDFIVDLPDGYETVIGERGVTLSGGQRQRLAIARALVKDAPIVLLDEPMTGLDARAEALVLAALEQLLAGRTAVLVAHRFSTLARADSILVLDEGRIVERGAHEDLIGQGGLYGRLFALQRRPAAGWRRLRARPAARPAAPRARRCSRRGGHARAPRAASQRRRTLRA
jgi:ABC-type multidrug transport system fused ATPase/permease subunit